ncbi:MAG TPA: cytochrome P450 [Longimicrobium sp.]|nr:cytochrome P450 [Longimicrobium sp.]
MSDLHRPAANRPPAAAPGAITLQRLVEAYKDPHRLYDDLRERNQVSFDPAARCWVVTGHEPARKILSDGRFVSEVALAIPEMRRSPRRTFASDAIQKQIIFVEGPKQARVQRAVLTELARRSDALTPPLQACAAALAGRARERGDFDLVRDFAVPFTMEAISLILGTPVGDAEEMARLERWSTSFADITSGYLHAKMEDVVLLGDYFRKHVAARGGTPSDDLIGAYMRDGGLDDQDDLVIQCMMAFAAGRVTTQKLLADGIPLLIPEWNAWRELVRTTPSALRRLVEEVLRVVTPTRYVVRYATEDVPLTDDSGAEIRVKRGERVVLILEAANRDADAFPSPHALIADRQPNPHVAFGFGPHRCPGASIARVEIAIALQALFDALGELRPHPSQPPAWDPNPNIGGYASYRCLCA